MTTKTCTVCKEIKPLTDYHLRSKKEPTLKSACILCHRERAKRYYRNKKYSKEYHKRMNLRKFFGLTLEEYNAILEKQDFRCAICNRHKDEFSRSLAVDHCHKTGHIRGLLCMYCNTALGKFEDSIERLEKSILYLKGKYNGDS